MEKTNSYIELILDKMLLKNSFISCDVYIQKLLDIQVYNVIVVLIYMTTYLRKFTGGSRLLTSMLRSMSLSSNFLMKG